jgi:hypothetical protein
VNVFGDRISVKISFELENQVNLPLVEVLGQIQSKNDSITSKKTNCPPGTTGTN